MNKDITDKNDKLLLLFAVILAALSITALFLFSKLVQQKQKTEELNSLIDSLNKNREIEITKLNKKLGLAESLLISQEQLKKQYEEELTEKDEEFEKLRKKYKLDIVSKDKTIAELLGQAQTGDTIVIGDCNNNDGSKSVISYKWTDSLQRFVLVDDDIFTKDNEQFNYKLKFMIKGEIFSDKTGNTKARKVELIEVHGDENTPVSNSSVQLISNDFTYINERELATKKKLSDIFVLRPLATYDIAMMPGIGLEFVNLGNLIDYANLGLYGKIAGDISSPLNGSLQNSRIGMGVNYHFVPPLLKTNFAVGASVNLPFNKLDSPILTIDAILYLTEDLLKN